MPGVSDILNCRNDTYRERLTHILNQNNLFADETLIQGITSLNSQCLYNLRRLISLPSQYNSFADWVLGVLEDPKLYLNQNGLKLFLNEEIYHVFRELSLYTNLVNAENLAFIFTQPSDARIISRTFSVLNKANLFSTSNRDSYLAHPHIARCGWIIFGLDEAGELTQDKLNILFAPEHHFNYYFSFDDRLIRSGQKIPQALFNFMTTYGLNPDCKSQIERPPKSKTLMQAVINNEPIAVLEFLNYGDEPTVDQAFKVAMTNGNLEVLQCFSAASEPCLQKIKKLVKTGLLQNYHKKHFPVLCSLMSQFPSNDHLTDSELIKIIRSLMHGYTREITFSFDDSIKPSSY